MSLKPWEEGYEAPDVEPHDPGKHAHKGGLATKKKRDEAGVSHGQLLPGKSDWAKKLEAITEDNITLERKMFYDRFIEEYLHDFSAPKAWLRAGGSAPQAPVKSYEILKTTYAQQKLKRFLDEIDEEQLVTNKEIIMGIKREANNFSEITGSANARVNAWKLLAQLRGMLVKKVEKNINHSGGVMLIPAQAKDVTTWEHEASDSQAKLKDDVRK